MQLCFIDFKKKDMNLLSNLIPKWENLQMTTTFIVLKYFIYIYVQNFHWVILSGAKLKGFSPDSQIQFKN